MPRISPAVLKLAAITDRRLPYLLRQNNGNISEAKQELRWIKNELSSSRSINMACWLRFNAVPLQYVLKSQPFGPLELSVRPGVLIPRWETEEWCIDLIENLPDNGPDGNFKSLDLCSGSGCIGLSISHARPTYSVSLVEFSSKAIAVLKDNIERLHLRDRNIQCIQADILKNSESIYANEKFNIITCNPPYIPSDEFVKECTTSVKMYEPRLALVADMEFYDNLVKHWIHRTESFVYEVGDIRQCQHVVNGLSHSNQWVTGIKYDSNNKARCVYGYQTASASGVDYGKIFSSFSTDRY
ncbi:unnamed protein product [Kluyveromyces dobzhanskii CBS 2104]|uniref:peptide chain release factor N(5)-glutamine methyltransferase n=1 Tax=Kluyveromyces dobzhanskii CBS 2104 TaxID=1427455 RepID=A0A0A8LB65_9SACH|nr:unnamed protein product [Kluyveromyces dobzhanskii CBS 2104]